jgi:hypothetical protein
MYNHHNVDSPDLHFAVVYYNEGAEKMRCGGFMEQQRIWLSLATYKNF